jgi:predicted metal-dependent hydrolase
MRLGAPVLLEFTDNTYTMISFLRRQGFYRLRLHHMFRFAPDTVLQSLAAYVRGDDRMASAELDAFIEQHRHLIRQLPIAVRQQRFPMKAKGRVHDLNKLLDQVRSEHFDEDADTVVITWAPAPQVRLPRRSIKLGSYSAETQIIRIHPALDQAFVPEAFVRWIIFHELLHHRFRADLQAHNGRVHTPEFCRLEEQFPEYDEAIKWERANLDVLLWWQPRQEPAPRQIPLRLVGV